jgi:Zn-dependent peptidase ImmA (M78 family)
MAKSEVPLNPAVLRWAMEQSGVGERELADRCGTTTQEVRSWLAGNSKPGKTQFNKLVARLRRPRAIYFLLEPPPEDPVMASFRHPPGADADRDLIDREQTSIRTAERIQQVARWTRARADVRPDQWPSLGASPAGQAARQAREFLEWDVEDQFRASSPSQVSAELRRRIEDRGVFVLQLKLSQEGCRGFSLEDEVAPVIAINSAYTIPARIFSMMHEVGHLVRHQRAFCARLPDNKTERWCERFAAIFLMPKVPFAGYVEKRFGDTPVSDIQEVESIARRFKVSLRAAALRVEQLELGVQGLYDRVDAQADFKGAGGFSNDNTTPAIRLREWGPSYARTITDAQQRGLLSPTDALEYLNVSRTQLKEMVDRLHVQDASSEE